MVIILCRCASALLCSQNPKVVPLPKKIRENGDRMSDEDSGMGAIIAWGTLGFGTLILNVVYQAWTKEDE